MSIVDSYSVSNYNISQPAPRIQSMFTNWKIVDVAPKMFYYKIILWLTYSDRGSHALLFI